MYCVLYWHTIYIYWLLIACLPAFFIGLIEDITAKIRAKHRLLIILFSAVLLIYFFKINSLNFGLSLLDQIMNQSIYHFPLLIWLFIVFSVTGLTNAFNIIDGLNGLSSSVAIFSACAITYVALKVNDLEIEVDFIKSILPEPCKPLLDKTILFSYFAPVP